MKRVKRHKIKKEKSDNAISQLREQEEHDLAYYIHDRVELMHQVFSILKYKELKAMAPECVRNLAIGDLQELCTEELLGISSKRLLAILDGAEPPSDTESSSPSPPPDLETISLDSISSDEELLASSSSKKKKHKHRRRDSKSKSKKKEKKAKEAEIDENAEVSKASRAGLTVLELLELQARARAIRAQLQQEQANKRPSETTAVESSHHSSDNEVEIKEEQPDVVEISSEDEKPDVNQLKENIADKAPSLNPVNTPIAKELDLQENSLTVTKRINDLIITVPQTKSTRKIKLNRNKVAVSAPNVCVNNENIITTEIRSITVKEMNMAEKTADTSKICSQKLKENKAKKKKKEKKKKNVEKDGSDHDEIMLQLSDSEKMDLFEALDESRKNYDKVSSSSEDSESSSSESEQGNISTEAQPSIVETEASPKKNIDLINSGKNISNSEKIEADSIVNIRNITNEKEKHNSEESSDINYQKVCENLNKDEENSSSTKYDSVLNTDNPEIVILEQKRNIAESPNNTEISKTSDSNTEDNTIPDTIIVIASNESSCVNVIDRNKKKGTNAEDVVPSKSSEYVEKVIEERSIEDIPILSSDATNNINEKSQKECDKDVDQSKETEKKLSDGELSERDSSEVEAVDLQPEVVFISDEENPSNKSSKKKKKKDKKTKKEKKLKKPKSDFREGADQNFYRDSSEHKNYINQQASIISSLTNEIKTLSNDETIDLNSDDVYEILELSDDSSCYEVEGTVLSKEPTAEEIEALSAKIDEIEREEVVTEEQIREHERMTAEKEFVEQNDENTENISWKDRYLGSKKVKKVLSTANILNALRKKNKELKKKIEESKKKEEEDKEKMENILEENNIQLEEGSIEHYNALQGSTKYVHPVKTTIQKEDAEENADESEKITKDVDVANLNTEMKRDAKQLLKMYKKLLKYNDMNKKKDPNKKKKKKQKKKDKHDAGNNFTTAETANVV